MKIEIVPSACADPEGRWVWRVWDGGCRLIARGMADSEAEARQASQTALEKKLHTPTGLPAWLLALAWDEPRDPMPTQEDREESRMP